MRQGINSKFSEDTKLGRMTDTSGLCSVQGDLNMAERKFTNSTIENAKSCSWGKQPHAPVHVKSRTGRKQQYRKWLWDPGGHQVDLEPITCSCSKE